MLSLIFPLLISAEYIIENILFTAMIIAVSPFASRIKDKKKREQFLNDVVEYYTEMGCRHPDGRFEYPCKMIVVFARK